VITQVDALCDTLTTSLTGSAFQTFTAGAEGIFYPTTVTSNTMIWNGPFFVDPGANNMTVFSPAAPCAFYLTGYYLTQ